ncbi:hypothetical protein GQ53DRAFT_79339 [Thozetella sp. PMI_491]|nr:hypothetical protein GQ53DRAFT_79339 [Thozetella sp. PMI_491]
METSRPTNAELQALVNTLNATNIQKATLTSICVVNGLPKTGNKPDLLGRIVKAVNEAYKARDLQRFKFIRESIHSRIGKATQPSPPPQSSPASNITQSSSSTSTNMPCGNSRSSSHGYYDGASYGGGGYNGNGYRAQSAASSYAQQGFSFKKSPFFEVLHRVGQLRTCEAMTQHRATINFTFKAPDDPLLQSTLTDPSLKVMVLCAAANTGVQEISFPHQSELKVNGDDAKANLRGLKNKPGSTRPADITQHLRLNKSAASNSVDFTYALTHHKFYVAVYVCRVTAVTTLVDKIRQHGKRISKASVISELTRKANDPDVVATSQVVSLKCPLSYMRLKSPVRGIACSHIQCFDALSYLQLQEQGPQWLCPICNKPASFDQLASDEYMKDILANTSESVDQITIEPDGRWLPPGGSESGRSPVQSRSQEPIQDVLDAEDFFEISSVAHVGGRAGSHQTPGLGTPKTFGVSATASYVGTPSFGTPSLATPKTTASPRPAPGSSNKRPAAEVIDLTLSDDDDEPSQPPPKRPNWGTNLTSSFPRK